MREEGFWDEFETFLAEPSEGGHTARDVMSRWPESTQGQGATPSTGQFIDMFMRWTIRVGLTGTVGIVVPDIRSYYAEDADVQTLEEAVANLCEQSMMVD